MPTIVSAVGTRTRPSEIGPGMIRWSKSARPGPKSAQFKMTPVISDIDVSIAVSDSVSLNSTAASAPDVTRMQPVIIPTHAKSSFVILLFLIIAPHFWGLHSGHTFEFTLQRRRHLNYAGFLQMT